MTDEPDDERRSFASRTPVNDNPDKVAYRRGFVTRHQVSGWRFVMRRIASGVALHDTRMLVDPLRTQTRAVAMGVLIVITALVGCFVFSLIRPNGSAANNPVLADRSTAALYVRVGDRLHPVLNLTSARLIVGRSVNPATVKSSELDKFPRGNLIGIPGAPERMVQSASKDADWTVCDSVAGPAGVTVIAGALNSGDASSGARAAALGAGHAVLASNGTASWLLWDGRRSRIDLADRAVTSALGLGSDPPSPRSIAGGLFNAIPEAPALAVPAIPDAGSRPRFDLPVSAPVGAVVESFALEKAADANTETNSEASPQTNTANKPANAVLYYAVLPDGVQPISPVLAAMLRNANSYDLDQPPRLGADQVAKLPVSRALDTSRYPDQRVRIVDTARDPLTCAHWSKPEGASTNSLTLLSGSTLPVPEARHTEDLVGAGTGGTASRVAMAPGTGYFTQTVGTQGADGGAASPAAGSLFWISDTGVRYGVDTEASEGSNQTSATGRAKTAEVLGLRPPPTPIPWSTLSLFAPGPTLSRADALLAHDSLAPDSRPGRATSAEETR